VRYSLPLLLIPLLSPAQTLDLGVKGGVPLSDAFETGGEFHIDFGEAAVSATRRYTVGPMLKLSLPHGLGLEFDALYKRIGFDDTLKSIGVQFAYTRAKANSWEFPILGTYRFLRRLPVNPYVAAGPSFRTAQLASVTGYGTFGGQPLPNFKATDNGIFENRSNRGVVVGVGAALHAGPLRLSPEVRYTRWAEDTQPDPYLHSNQNQVEVLLGIGIKAH
jgi:hypothetical protein